MGKDESKGATGLGGAIKSMPSLYLTTRVNIDFYLLQVWDNDEKLANQLQRVGTQQ